MPPVPPATSPRKRPVQARSRATVETILDGAAHILIRDGFDRATTTRIAEAAGVGIGSLYQYFPSKEAVVAALIDRHAAALTRVFDDLAPRLAGRPPAEAVAMIVAAATDAHRLHPALHRVLNEQVPRIGDMARIRDVSAAITSHVARWIATLPLAPGRDPAILAVLVERSIEAVVHGALADGHDRLPRALHDELVTMLARHLAPETPRQDQRISKAS
ncbi:TetR/AcrR family transcriptional regulator [Tistrella mobilis]|uniref:TetR/AcrR family transcriptional regulator n=1 Tax=Tistrella mobilis TaxID=171437 RepID=UPI0031F632F3